MKHKFIAVEGNIGAGKTTLAKFMHQQMDANLLLENFEDNPFLERFYERKDVYAFDTEIFFLKDRIRQLQTHPLEKHLISDFTLFKSKIFAGINLNTEEYLNFEDHYNRYSEEVRLPDVIIYLDSPVGELQKQIEKRGRAYEKRIDPGYLHQLRLEYQKQWNQINDIPIISLESKKIIFPLNTAQINKIIEFSLDTDHKGVMDFTHLL